MENILGWLLFLTMEFCIHFILKISLLGLSIYDSYFAYEQTETTSKLQSQGLMSMYLGVNEKWENV